MNQFFQYIQSIPMQVWVLLAVFGFSVLGQIGKSLSAVKQKRRLDQERQKRADESMRTGRPVPDPAQAQASEIEARRQRLAEMQQRRQAQLDELRKRRQEMIGRQAALQAQARTSAPTAGQPAPPAGPTGMPRGVPQIGPQPGSHQVVRATPGPRQAPRPAPRSAPQPASRFAPSAASRPGSHSVSQATAIKPTGQKPTGHKPAHQPHATIHASESLGSMGGHKMQRGAVSKPFQHAIEDAGTTGRGALHKHGIRLEGREDLRRAIILSEILAKPVAMRPERLADFD